MVPAMNLLPQDGRMTPKQDYELNTVDQVFIGKQRRPLTYVCNETLWHVSQKDARFLMQRRQSLRRDHLCVHALVNPMHSFATAFVA